MLSIISAMTTGKASSVYKVLPSNYQKSTLGGRGAVKPVITRKKTGKLNLNTQTKVVLVDSAGRGGNSRS